MVPSRSPTSNKFPSSFECVSVCVCVSLFVVVSWLTLFVLRSDSHSRFLHFHSFLFVRFHFYIFFKIA